MHNKRSKIKPDEDLPSPGAGSVQVWPSAYSHQPFFLTAGGKTHLSPVFSPPAFLRAFILYTHTAHGSKGLSTGLNPSSEALLCYRMRAERKEAEGETSLLVH